MELESGQQLHHYRLVEKIGEGGMGVVWKALDTHLDRHVAVKILPDAFAGDTERLARFEREAKLLASLNHPNIAAVHGLDQDRGVRFLVMELVASEGGTPEPETLGDDASPRTNRYPSFLPDGDHFFFLDRGSSAGTGSNPTIRVGSLSEGPTEGKTVVHATSNAVYADGQRLLVHTPLSEDKPQPVVLVQNWKEGLP